MKIFATIFIAISTMVFLSLLSCKDEQKSQNKGENNSPLLQIEKRKIERALELRKNASPITLYRLGEYYAMGGSFEVAIKHYQDAAEQGHAKSQAKLAEYYLEGIVVEKNIREAEKLLLNSAKGGDIEAQHQLSMLYEKNEGFEQSDGFEVNEVESIKWGLLAAENGHAPSQWSLGNRYAEGRGVPKDEKTSVYWYRLAAEQGDKFGQFLLGKCYEEGKGVEMDLITAYMWIYLSGVEKTDESLNLERISKKMNASQIEEALKSVNKWEPMQPNF